MAIILPHVFQDGVGETASGVQVDEDLNVLKAAIETLEGSVAGLLSQKSGQKGSNPKAPPTNTHEQIPESEIATPALISGQVLLAIFTAYLAPGANIVFARLTVNGVETGPTLASATSDTYTAAVRLTGLTGVVKLAGNAWATSSVGEVACNVYYQILGG